MKKAYFVFGAVLALFVVIAIGFAVSAQSNQNDKKTDDLPEQVKDAVDQKTDSEISTEIYDYVLSFVKKKNVLPSEISKVKEVDFDALPKEVNIENVGDHNLAIYEISYTKDGISDQVYVVTYSVEELKAQGDLIVAQDKRQFLNFGYAGTMDKSGFLKTATDVESSLEKGYVMVRDGSITAVSTNLEVSGINAGDLEIIVYINGEQVGFGNIISTDTSGIKKDYDVQSKDVANFKAGDVVSVYLKSNGNASWKDVITMIEITTSS